MFVGDVLTLMIEEGLKVVTTGAGTQVNTWSDFMKQESAFPPNVAKRMEKIRVQMLSFVKVWKPVDTLK